MYISKIVDMNRRKRETAKGARKSKDTASALFPYIQNAEMQLTKSHPAGYAFSSPRHQFVHASFSLAGVNCEDLGPKIPHERVNYTDMGIASNLTLAAAHEVSFACLGDISLRALVTVMARSSPANRASS